jgi:hypothetical protein
MVLKQTYPQSCYHDLCQSFDKIYRLDIVLFISLRKSIGIEWDKQNAEYSPAR